MYTHCGVSNFALSVSEAIAKPQRSRIIWTIAIAIHAPIKLYYSFELAKFYVDYLYNRVRVIQKYLISIPILLLWKVPSFILCIIAIYVSEQNSIERWKSK